jgi:hypothetical protein
MSCSRARENARQDFWESIRVSRLGFSDYASLCSSSQAGVYSL